jgi:segregation and condensation protein B
MTSKLANIIAGILFYESDSLKLDELISLTNETEDNIKQALDEISLFYNTKDTSINLLSHNDSYQFTIAGDARDLIMVRDAKERDGELSRAALETLSSIMYLSQATKNEIDYIRGVQSSYMLRVLVSRGLIARSNSSKTRGTVYIPTIETLRFMGLEKIEDMPDYEKIHNDLSNAAKNSNVIED